MLRVSIVTPSFNQAEFVGQTLESVARQTLQPFEHLIYDPGSTDGTLEKLQDYVRSHSWADLEIGKDSSQSHAINLGFSRSKGDILCWLNTDDWYAEPDVLEVVARRFEEEPDLDILYGRGRFVAPDGGVLKDVFIIDDPSRLLARMAFSVGILQPALFMRRRVFEQLGPIREDLHYCLDYEYWIRASKRGLKFGFIDRFLCNATMHDRAKTVEKRVESLHETLDMVRKQYGFVPVQWLNKLADAELNGSDGILQSASWRSPQHLEAVDNAFDRFNVDARAIRGLMEFEHPEEIAKTIELLKLRVSASDRYVVMALDQHNHAAGLALLESLKARHQNNLAFLVFDTGLDDEQRAGLSGVGGAWVFPAPDRGAGLVGSGHGKPDFAASSAGFLLQAQEWVRDGALMLWLDPHRAAGYGLALPFALIERQDVLLVLQGDPADPAMSNIVACSEACATILAANNRELLAVRIDPAIVGVKARDKYQFLLDASQVAARKSGVLSSEARRPEAGSGAAMPVDQDALSFSEMRRITGSVSQADGDAALSILATRYAVPMEGRATLIRVSADQPPADVAASTTSKMAVPDPAIPAASPGIEPAPQDASSSLARHTRNLAAWLRERSARVVQLRPVQAALVCVAVAAAVLFVLLLMPGARDTKTTLLAVIAVAATGGVLFLGYYARKLAVGLAAANADLRREAATVRDLVEALQVDARSDRRRNAAALDLMKSQTESARQLEIEALARRNVAIEREILDLRQAQESLRQLAARATPESEFAKVAKVGPEFAKLWDRVNTLQARIESEAKRGATISGLVDDLRKTGSERTRVQETFNQLAVQAVGRTQYLAASLNAIEQAIADLGDDLLRMSMMTTALQLAIEDRSQAIDSKLQSAGEGAADAISQVRAMIVELEEATEFDRMSLVAAWQHLRSLSDDMAASDAVLAARLRSLGEHLSAHAGTSDPPSQSRPVDTRDDALSSANASEGQHGPSRQLAASASPAGGAALEKRRPPGSRTRRRKPTEAN